MTEDQINKIIEWVKGKVIIWVEYTGEAWILTFSDGSSFEFGVKNE